MSAAAGQLQRGLPAHRFPVRTCVACRTERQKRDLLRVVRAPDGSVSFDPTGRAAGRGAYICADGSCWAVAIKKKSIERALSAPLPAELRSRLEQRDESLLTSAGGGANGPQ